MKIQEKGLTGKSAANRKGIMASRGFNAFRDMTRSSTSTTAAGTSSAGTTNGTTTTPAQTTEKKDVYLEFMGARIMVYTDAEGNGTVKAEDVPFVKGSTLKFVGCGGSVSWNEIKVCSWHSSCFDLI